MSKHKQVALSTAHSHAFQRGMRGESQRPGPAAAGSDDFWSWRTAMYSLADSLTPESIHDISLVAYRELYAAGAAVVEERLDVARRHAGRLGGRAAFEARQVTPLHEEDMVEDAADRRKPPARLERDGEP